ncbi:MAG: sulfotransferase [Cyclobacteriaceae bacterium]
MSDVRPIKNKLVFLVGFPRSGTTYLQSLLGTQNGIVSLPESHFFGSVSAKAKIEGANLLDTDSFFRALNQIVSMMKHNFSEDEIKCLKQKAESNILTKDLLFCSLLESYFSRNQVQLADSDLILEKTPDHVRKIYEIESLFPEAKFICITRHPVDAINSFYEKLVKYRQPYQKLAAQWLQSSVIVEQFSKDYPNKIIAIKYEDLIADNVNVLEKICGFLAIKLEKEKLKNFRIAAAKYILPTENWKLSNTAKSYRKSINKIPLLERVRIQHKLTQEMKRLEYPIKHKALVRLYQSVFKPYLRVRVLLAKMAKVLQ